MLILCPCSCVGGALFFTRMLVWDVSFFYEKDNTHSLLCIIIVITVYLTFSPNLLRHCHAHILCVVPGGG